MLLVKTEGFEVEFLGDAIYVGSDGEHGVFLEAGDVSVDMKILRSKLEGVIAEYLQTCIQHKFADVA